MTMKFSAPCIFGLEGLCANELRYLGVENVNAENGRVTFTGDWSTLALANINFPLCGANTHSSCRI